MTCIVKAMPLSTATKLYDYFLAFMVTSLECLGESQMVDKAVDSVMWHPHVSRRPRPHGGQSVG